MYKKEKWIKLGATALCEGFTAYTILSLLAGNEPDRLALAFGTILLVLLPMLAERLFSCRICLPLYLFTLFYAIGPMLGHCWKLYYTLPWWDKLLHTSAGMIFAILGAYLFDLLAQGKQKQIARILFAFCFSVTVSVLWEFAEFGADTFLGMDMQNDRVVNEITSYLLGQTIGTTGSIDNIHSVVVNGIALPGYIDIGLHDSMLDRLLESLGALSTCVLLFFDKDRHALIKREKRTIVKVLCKRKRS